MMTQVLAALVGKFSDDNNLSKAVGYTGVGWDQATKLSQLSEN